MFAEKLDFLMKLTGARNSALGRTAHVDASTVSRLRAGKRELPKKQNFLPLMCDYFARNITTRYQRQSAADAICPGQSWPQERGLASALILAWLTKERSTDESVILDLVSDIALFSFKAPDVSAASLFPEPVEGEDVFYYGNAGKRAAVARFLLAVIHAKNPRTLLLYSDESIDWLWEDVAFARQWALLMRKAIQNGNRIRIIHTIGRTLNEMLEALEKWIGVYMTGAVEPYYCPRLRDGITRRTLFIAPDLAAVCASSVGDRTEGGLNLYLRDRRSLEALENEFAGYFALSQPLMRILTGENGEAARGLLRELMNAQGDVVIVQGAPSLAAMPKALARSVCDRCGHKALMQMWADAADAFQKNVESYSVYELFPIVGPSAFSNAPARLPSLGLPEMGSVFYTRDEYAAHLAGVAEKLDVYPNYHVLPQSPPFLPANLALYHQAHAGTILARTDGSPIVFAISAPSMTIAFSEYLTRQVAQAKKPGYRQHVAEQLRAAIREG